MPYLKILQSYLIMKLKPRKLKFESRSAKQNSPK